MDRQYADRRSAGRLLAAVLREHHLPPETVVLGLARGGVPVAFEVADALGFDLDVLTIRKLGVPGHPELAMGAIASGGVQVLNQDVIDELRITPGALERVAASERLELERRELAYRRRPPPDLHGRTVVLVDDGLATGASMRAAVEAVRRMGAERTVVAVPVAAPESCRELTQEFDRLECVCPFTPSPFSAVGLWYRDFRATGDDEVRDLLDRATARRASRSGGPDA